MVHKCQTGERKLIWWEHNARLNNDKEEYEAVFDCWDSHCFWVVDEVWWFLGDSAPQGLGIHLKTYLSYKFTKFQAQEECLQNKHQYLCCSSNEHNVHWFSIVDVSHSNRWQWLVHGSSNWFRLFSISFSDIKHHQMHGQPNWQWTHRIAWFPSLALINPY